MEKPNGHRAEHVTSGVPSPAMEHCPDMIKQDEQLTA
jgi:hypothetical protein